MNKSKTIFLFILFVGFGFLGFLIMNGIKGLFSTTTNPPAPKTILNNQQQNLILLHVDDLTAQDPQLISIWAIFFYPSQPPSITMKELYPHPYENEEDNQIREIFSITQTGEMNSKFIKKLNAYPFQWSGYVLIDHQSVFYLSNWLQMQTIPLSLQQAIQNPGAYVQAADEAQWFDQICDQIQTLDLQNIKPLPWTEIIPEHMHSNIYFDDMVTIWDNLARSEIPPHCEVLIP